MNDCVAERPRVVIAVGVYRSASTWAANVTAEIMRTQGPTAVVVADTVAEMTRQIGSSSSAFVVKTHRPDATLRLLMRMARIPIILSVRDPSDCVTSLMEQFKEFYETARGTVALSCEAVMSILPICAPLLLRYESAAARSAETVRAMAAHIGIPIDLPQADAIAERFSPAAVGRLIAQYAAQGVFGPAPRPFQVHAPTQWHPGHLGTGEVGRHASILTASQIAWIEDATRPFRARFGYESPRDPVSATRFAPSPASVGQTGLPPAWHLGVAQSEGDSCQVRPSRSMSATAADGPQTPAV